MNKYLLWVLLASSSVPAYSQVFELQEGTMRVQDFFHMRDKTWPMKEHAWESVGYKSWSKYPGEWSFRGQWYTSSPYNITGMTGTQSVQINIPNTLDYSSFTDAKDVWTEKGTGRFPTGVETIYVGCGLPDSLTSEDYPSGGVLTYSVFGLAEAKSASTSETYTIHVHCSGNYVIRKNVDVTLVDSVINLKGSTSTELNGRTSMLVSGFGGLVTVRIENPNTAEVSVSFDPNNDVSTTTMDLTQQSQYEQQIYVRANTSVPGRHEYRVQLVGEFK